MFDAWGDPLAASLALQVVALVVRAGLFGLYLGTLAHSLRWLVFEDEGWKLRKKIGRPMLAMLAIIILLFLLAIADLRSDLRITFGTLAFFSSTPHINVPNQVISSTGIPDVNLAITLNKVAILLIDAVLIYRCWIVYDRLWRVICLPILLWLSCILFIALQAVCAKPSEANRPVCRVNGANWLVAFFACNILVNAYTTVALILRVLRAAKAGGSRHLHKLSRIFAESGIVYTMSSAFSLIVSIYLRFEHRTQMEIRTQIFVSRLVHAINTTMACVAFNLIIIRVKEQHVNQDNSFADSDYSSQPCISTVMEHESRERDISTNDK